MHFFKVENEIERSKLASNQALLYICPKRLAEAGKVASLIKAIASGRWWRRLDDVSVNVMGLRQSRAKKRASQRSYVPQM